MVYKERTSSIIMLTELSDGNQEQCVKYWPDDVNEWNEWKINEGRMAANNGEISGEIAVLKMCEGPAWEGSEGLITKRSFLVFSNSNPNQEVRE